MEVYTVIEKPKVAIDLELRQYISDKDLDAMATIRIKIIGEEITQSTIECDKKYLKDLVHLLYEI